MTYFTDEEKKLYSKEKSVIKDESSIFRGEKVEYYPKTETINSLESYTIDYKDFKFKGNSGTF